MGTSRSSPVLLALDVGNTNVTAGVFRGERLVKVFRLVTAAYPSSYSAALRRLEVGAVVYGSVVPRLDRVFERLSRKLFGVKALAITPSSPLGLKLRVRTPKEVGADRVLNALAARELFGAPAVVVDFGTATTFDCVSRSGDYLGGAILPGPHLASQALALHTAKLPLIEVARPRRVIGKDTKECIQAGLYYGYVGMIERVLAGTVQEMGCRPKLIATGGLAGMFSRELEFDAVSPDLTLQGLRLAYEKICP
ncbi:MAG: type III pantothenate kinase [Elusimicrobiota bacterium]